MSIKEKAELLPGFIKKPMKYIYNSLPEYVKESEVFRRKYKFLKESQYWTRTQHNDYQMEQLKKIIKHAYETVPYYKRVFYERGLTPNSIQSFEDLKKLPYLTKDIVQNNLEELISNKFSKKNMQYETTGGSTGIPMGFYDEKNVSLDIEKAFIFTQWNRVGFNIHKRNRTVILRGDIPENGIYQRIGDTLILSSFVLTNDNMKEYVKVIEEFQPDFIQAYPSSINMLSEYIINNNITNNFKNLKAILCGSENLYDFQRKNIEKAFNARVYSWYGHTEKCCLAGECEKSNYYHIFSEYGYIELIGSNGEEVTEEDEVGEIVATGFNNYVVPFIRYRTDDLAINTNKICSCGRNYKLIKKIEGRKQEYFVDLYKNKVTFIWADYPLWQCKDRIWAYQYIQNEPGKVILNINFKNVNEIYDLEKIKKVFIKYYPQIYIEIRKVGYIERTKRGKFKYLVQNI